MKKMFKNSESRSLKKFTMKIGKRVLLFFGPQPLASAPAPCPLPNLLFYGPRPKLLFRSPHVSKLLFHGPGWSKLLFHRSVFLVFLYCQSFKLFTWRKIKYVINHTFFRFCTGFTHTFVHVQSLYFFHT